MEEFHPNTLSKELLSDFKVFIINRYPPLTSPYRWAEDLSATVRAMWINLIFENKGWEYTHKGVDFQSRFLGNNALTHIFRTFSFSNAVRYIDVNSSKRKKIIHYTNQFSGLLRFKGAIEIVSVQDSPYYLENDKISSRVFMNRIYSSIKNKDYIITNTNVLNDELRQYGFTGHIETIHLSYSPIFSKLDENKKSLRNKLGLPLDKKLVLSISSDLPRKNLQAVRNAVDSLGEQYKLVRIGSQLGNSITFTRIGDETLNQIYNSCDVLLFPSLYEGFGLPIVEAFASGLPVVASDIPTIREVAGNAAILVDPENLNSIMKGIKDAIHNVYLSERGIVRAKDFTKHKFEEKVTHLYDNILKTG
jgi:glycosyltransferase involved in cell wall biosynthesis